MLQTYSYMRAHVHLHNNTRSRRPTTTVCSNDTLVDTPFQLISDFFVLCSEHAEQALCVGGGGGGGNRLAKSRKGEQQASWFSN